MPELMHSLNNLVVAGKVLYLGISDAPAWVVSKANEYARWHGLRQFSVYQGKWSAASRDLERDIIPMCRAEGMSITPWGALGGGKFRTEEQLQQGKKEGRDIEPSEAEIKVSKALEAVAKRKNTLLTSVAQAYVTSKTSYVIPIIGMDYP
jgi:aryl-alcohol dehydrogenase-like predicted oxidoreductase